MTGQFDDIISKNRGVCQVHWWHCAVWLRYGESTFDHLEHFADNGFTWNPDDFTFAVENTYFVDFE